MTTAYFLWEDMKPGGPGPGQGEQDLAHLLDLLHADMSASLRQRPRLQRGLALRRGLTLRRWVRRIAFAHGD